jgi:hypothetical protein
LQNCRNIQNTKKNNYSSRDPASTTKEYFIEGLKATGITPISSPVFQKPGSWFWEFSPDGAAPKFLIGANKPWLGNTKGLTCADRPIGGLLDKPPDEPPKDADKPTGGLLTAPTDEPPKDADKPTGGLLTAPTDEPPNGLLDKPPDEPPKDADKPTGGLLTAPTDEPPNGLLDKPPDEPPKDADKPTGGLLTDVSTGGNCKSSVFPLSMVGVRWAEKPAELLNAPVETCSGGLANPENLTLVE